jgi:hypothetical protein
MGSTVIRQRVVLTLGLISGVRSDVISQLPANTAAPQEHHLSAQLQILKPSSWLRIRANDGRREGRLALRTADSLGLRGAESDTRLPLVAVDTLWVRRHYTKTGFLVGALMGVAGYVWVTSYAEEDLDELHGLDNLFGGLICAGSVALGTIIGALIPGWKRLYP